MKAKKIIITIIIVALCGAGVWVTINKGNSVTAQTMAVALGEIKQYVEESATVKCKEEQTIYIEGAGRINEIILDAGSKVKKGDLLLSIDDADLQLQLKDAQSRVEAAKAQIDSTNSSNYATDIEIASVQVVQAEITYNSALRFLDNATALYDMGSISEEELNQAKDRCAVSEAALKAAKLQLEKVKKGVPEYVKKGYISQLEQAVILQDTLKRSIEKQQVYSPVDGVILEKLVDSYQMAAPGVPAFIIGDTDSIELEANILSDDSHKVELGDEVAISGKTLGEGILKGKVTRIAPVAKTMTSALGVNQKRVQIIIDFIAKPESLKPGYSMDIKIITDLKSNITAVPDSALFDYEGSSCVFIVQEDEVVIRQVKKGLEGDGLIEITEGLQQGETILVKPDNNIKEGVKIKPSNSEASFE